MKQLIPINEHGIFADCNDTAWVDSRYIADTFEKNHKDVLRDIRRLLSPESGLTEDFRRRNFAQSSYINEQHKKQPCYALTRDGFTFLAMGYTGAKAAQFKEAYIRRFNEMEAFIRLLQNTRQEFPLLTENVKLLHPNPKPYHFSNECDLINKLVLGMSAKKFRETHGIPKGESIRPYLSPKQLEQIEYLQIADIGLMMVVSDFQERKHQLEQYKIRCEADQPARSRRRQCHDTNQPSTALSYPG